MSPQNVGAFDSFLRDCVKQKTLGKKENCCKDNSSKGIQKLGFCSVSTAETFLIDITRNIQTFLRYI